MNPSPAPDKTLLFISAALLLSCGGMVGLAILAVALLAPPSPPPPVLPTTPPTITQLPATITQLPELALTVTPLLPTASPDVICPDGAKIAFDKSTGCQNDGSFEFCIPAYDSDAMQAVLRLAPGTSCGPGRGRAQCNEDQLLCLVSTTGLCIPNISGAMNDYGWEVACSLAGLPFIESIVPTWYE